MPLLEIVLFRLRRHLLAAFAGKCEREANESQKKENLLSRSSLLVLASLGAPVGGPRMGKGQAAVRAVKSQQEHSVRTQKSDST